MEKCSRKSSRSTNQTSWSRRWKNEERQVAEVVGDETRSQKWQRESEMGSGRERIRSDKPPSQVDATRCEEIREDRCKI